MLKHAVFAGFALTFAGVAFSANAQNALSSCDPVTGTTPSGAPCVELTPIDPGSISSPTGALDGDRYDKLDTSTLGQTYECRTIENRDRQYGQGGALLIEDCGAPLSPSEMGALKPFYGTVGAPTPTPVPVAPTPTPIAALPPAPVLAAPVAAPAFAPVTATAAAGLGGIGLAATAIGAAALVGVVAVIAGDDDDDSTNSTTNTRLP